MANMQDDNKPVVAMKGIVKHFPGVLAVDHVNFDLYPGEVHSLLGENGAGKTTLMNILCGLYTPDEGEVYVRGERVHFQSAQDAIQSGLDMVHQHFQLVNSFTVVENVMLGQRSSRHPLMENKNKVRKRVEEISDRFCLGVDPDAEIWQISVGEQQRVEILKTLYRGAEVLILDEPTAVLTPHEADALLTIIRELAAEGRAIVFISHKLNEVLAISDRITVLRDGKVVGTVDRQRELVQQADLARMMVGREVFLNLEKQPCEPGETQVVVEDLWVRDDRGLPAVKGISLEIRAGEILGLAGVAGNGQRELEEALRGLRRVEKGKIIICGQDTTSAGPQQVIAQRMAHIPSDRYGCGMLDDATIAENLVLETFWQAPYTRRTFLNRQAIACQGELLVKQYDVRTPSVMTYAGTLSGGNAQKMVLARELSLEPSFLLAAQPTRGLDINATEYLRRTLLEQRDKGVAILLISSELEEIFSLSDRIAVIYEGMIIGMVPAEARYREATGLMMAGTHPELL